MASPKITIGSLCQDQKGDKKFIVLGFCENSLDKTSLHPSADSTWPNGLSKVKGIELDSEKTCFVYKNLLNLKLEEDQIEENMAKDSLVFHDTAILKGMIESMNLQQSEP